MRSQFASELNDLLVDTFASILKVEELSLRRTGDGDLSISEFHLLECVANGIDSARSIGDIAQQMSITLPSVTIAINKLAAKGYVEKAKSPDDGRVVIVTLTKLGKRMNAAHRYFHEQMVREVSREFDDEELELLLKCIDKLNIYFKKHAHNESNLKRNKP